MLPKQLERKAIYESPWINLYIDKVQMPSGKIIDKYHQLDYPKESVVVLLVNSKGAICFIKSLRYTTQSEEWELPAGSVDKGEDVIEAAKREGIEETGFKVINLEEVYRFNPSIGMSNQLVHVLFGEVQDDKQDVIDEDEVRETNWLKKDQIQSMIAKNEIIDGISLLPLLLYFSKDIR